MAFTGFYCFFFWASLLLYGFLPCLTGFHRGSLTETELEPIFDRVVPRFTGFFFYRINNDENRSTAWLDVLFFSQQFSICVSFVGEDPSVGLPFIWPPLIGCAGSVSSAPAGGKGASRRLILDAADVDARLRERRRTSCDAISVDWSRISCSLLHCYLVLPGFFFASFFLVVLGFYRVFRTIFSFFLLFYWVFTFFFSPASSGFFMVSSRFKWVWSTFTELRRLTSSVT